MVFRILSLDGGGIRGIISARILQYIEQQLEKHQLGSLLDYFDLVAGTSTGSLIAGGIVMGRNATQLRGLYENRGIDIFPYTSRFNLRRLRLVLQHGLSAPKFSDEGLKTVLKDEFGYDATLGSITPDLEKSPKLLITAYDTLRREPLIFKSWRHDKWYAQLPLWKVCACSASAPTFFPAQGPEGPEVQDMGQARGGNANTITLASHAFREEDAYKDMEIQILEGTGKGQVSKIGHYSGDLQIAQVNPPWKTPPDNTSTYGIKLQYSIIDGGVGANNPTACAVAEAIRLLRHQQSEKQESSTSSSMSEILGQITVLSIGTGNLTSRIPWEQVRSWGLAQWAPRIVDVIMDAPSDIHYYIARQIITAADVDDARSRHYLRLQPRLSQDLAAIDNASPDYLRALVKATDKYLSNREAQLTEFLRLQA
ncbi:MAG: patatin [Cyanothece sp. SIO1E1]|nr:patatin [Cyanothece sp. SIO1E1]